MEIVAASPDLPSLAVAAINHKLAEVKGRADVPYVGRSGSFGVRLVAGGVSVDNLGSQPFLPWAVFRETVSLLVHNGGHAPKGNAMSYRLGDEKLPLDSVEGHVAAKVFGRKVGNSVFRRISAIAAILVWAGVCSDGRGTLSLSTSFPQTPFL